MSDIKRGYIHLYTGNGKGKTTAALGLTMRAIGTGHKVLFVQFIKSGEFSEIKALHTFPEQVAVRQFGNGRKGMRLNPEKSATLTQNGLEWVQAQIKEHSYHMIVLDEVCIALHKEYLSLQQLCDLMEQAPTTEWVLTGRYAPEALIAEVDLCSTIEPTKHYFQEGVAARKGVEF